MRATVPACSGATPESTENLTTAWPFEPSPMDRTDPDLGGTDQHQVARDQPAGILEVGGDV